jgi:four helix bundle protein
VRNTKHQTPNTKKLSTANPQPAPLANGWHYAEPVTNLTLELKEDGAAPSDGPVQRHPFDFEERTAVFGEQIVHFSKSIPRSPANDRLISQIVGAGTSVGANFCEANDCVSKKDFRNILKRCIKEAKETRFFLRMIVAADASFAMEARRLYREASELIKIMAAMYRK